MPDRASADVPGRVARREWYGQRVTAAFRDRIDLLPSGARVLVGMSGGVDSSVAAAILRDRGFQVVGVSLHLWEYQAGDASPSRCCAPEDLDDARRTAEHLRIPHFTFDRTSEFAGQVVDPFVEGYLSGITPSPCVSCNREVKVAAFVALCRKLGAAGFATGHYARAGVMGERPCLLRADDASKDQSYFLHGIGVDALSLLLTPLGGMRKDEVRAYALRVGLHNAHKPDSEDLCFTAGDHAGFVERRAKDRVRPGPIVDGEGREVGRHQGIHRFTVGQRKGIGVAVGRPAFVAAIDPVRAIVQLGDARDLESQEALVEHVEWLSQPLIGPRKVTAKIRYRHDGERATVEPHALGARVVFDAPMRAITAGQVCVFYDGDEVLGGGTFSRDVRAMHAGNSRERAGVVSEYAGGSSRKPPAPLV